jgi:hypothetical protein
MRMNSVWGHNSGAFFYRLRPARGSLESIRISTMSYAVYFRGQKLDWNGALRVDTEAGLAGKARQVKQAED